MAFQKDSRGYNGVTMSTTDPVSMQSAEMDEVREWTALHLDGEALPFSFQYDGRPAAECVKNWRRETLSRMLDNNRTESVTVYTDPGTGLVLRCMAVTYADFPTVEWTIHLENRGTSATPIIENIQAIDWRMGKDDIILHYHVGSPAKPEDYRPLTANLAPGMSQRVTTCGGRPSNSHLPYFNVAWADGGVIMALGWPGQWTAEFARGSDGELRITGGQEVTRFKLLPGERVRGPLMVLQFYTGDWIRGQNIWRRWMVTHNLPRPGGQLPSPLACGTAWSYFAPHGISNAQTIKTFIDTYKTSGIPIDIWWTDAGWYHCDTSVAYSGYSYWNHTGTWEADPRRFPKGLREVSDHAHKNGLKTVVWFEPERVVHGTWLDKQHPEWLLNLPPGDEHPQVEERQTLLNLGNPEALRWLIGHVDEILTRDEIDIYREDFNFDPLPYWRATDAEDRQGITEMLHVTGHLAYWDELRRRHPNLLLDTCASGGRRNDLESLRRAVPLTRSDYIPLSGSPKQVAACVEANQNITYGIAHWIPYFGTVEYQITIYGFRSMMSPCIVFDLDPRRTDLDGDLWRKLLQQHKDVGTLYTMGDYYPLTPYSLEDNVWMAWQFHCPETHTGMIQAFRRGNCPDANVCLTLQGLDPRKIYAVTDQDSGETRRIAGHELMEKGLRVAAPEKPAALLLTYAD